MKRSVDSMKLIKSIIKIFNAECRFETAFRALPSSFKDSLGRPAISGNAPFDPSTKNSEEPAKQ